MTERICNCGTGFPMNYTDHAGVARWCSHCAPDFAAMQRDPECLAKMRGPAYDASLYASQLAAALDRS